MKTLHSLMSEWQEDHIDSAHTHNNGVICYFFAEKKEVGVEGVPLLVIPMEGSLLLSYSTRWSALCVCHRTSDWSRAMLTPTWSSPVLAIIWCTVAVKIFVAVVERQ